MTAGFETDIGGSALSGIARAAERLGLAVRPTTRLRPAASNDAVPIDDDAADRRVWPYRAEAAPGQRQRRAHPAEIEVTIVP